MTEFNTRQEINIRTTEEIYKALVGTIYNRAQITDIIHQINSGTANKYRHKPWYATTYRQQ